MGARRATILALGLGSLACSSSSPAAPEPIPQSELEPGLILRGGEFATKEDHLVELLVHAGHVYVANSTLGVAVMSLDEDGGLSLTDVGTTLEDGHRCTSLAVHAPSSTLYCGADAPYETEEIHVEIYDISTPGRALWRGRLDVEEWGTRDLEVVGDRLLINHFDGGLWTAQIDAEGKLSQLSQTAVEGNARVTVSVGDRLVMLVSDPEQGSQLRLLDPQTFAELHRLPLSGPPLGLSADAEGAARVAVGLGSAGMALVSIVDDQLIVDRTLEPPAVVTTGLVAGELAVAVTLTGAFAWQLDAAEGPRMFGFGPAGQLGRERAGNMIHGVLHEGELIASDWLWVERWAIEPEGVVLELDVPRGVYVGPEGGARFRLRNPGEATLRAELWAARSPLWTGEIGPGELAEVELSPERRGELLAPEDPSVPVVVRVYDPLVPSEGQPSSTSRMVLAQREPSNPLPPATGDLFPTVTLADLDGQVFTLPLAGGSQTIWYTPDCALMWPQLEDLAWLERSGVDLGRGEPVMISQFDVAADGFPTRWGIEGSRFGTWGPIAPAVGDANDHLDPDDLYMAFFIQELPGDAMPTDYVIDGEGVIRSIERMYRGPWTLAVPWPW